MRLRNTLGAPVFAVMRLWLTRLSGRAETDIRSGVAVHTEPPARAGIFTPGSLDETDGVNLIGVLLPCTRRRVDMLHARVRALSPELLLPFAGYNAAMSRLIDFIEQHPSAMADVRGLLVEEVGLLDAAIDAALHAPAPILYNRKVSVVLASPAEEYATYRVEALLNEQKARILTCLSGLRSGRTGQEHGNIAGKVTS